MKLNRKWRATSLQLSTPGMIDVVFLLLIFFLVNASYRPNEKQVEVSSTDPNKASATTQLQPLEINIVIQGQQVRFLVGGRSFGSLESLSNWLRQWPGKEQPIVVNNAVSCPVGTVIQTINRARLAGFKNVSHNPVMR